MTRRQKTSEEKIEELRSELMAAYLAEREESFSDFLIDAASDSDSPIEKLMAMGLAYLISCDNWYRESKWNQFHFVVGTDPFEVQVQFEPTHPGVDIWPECPVGTYRADFLVRYAAVGGGYCFGAIECDGHDYHDRTKEQASHDRERDRYFQDQGITILRYTGSDIWRGALKCASDAMSILERRAQTNPWRRWRP